MTTSPPPQVLSDEARARADLWYTLHQWRAGHEFPGRVDDAIDDYKRSVLGSIERAVLDAAPQREAPKDEAREILAELVALKDLGKSHAQASQHYAKFPTPQNLATIERLSKIIHAKTEPAWSRARAVVGSKPCA